MPRKNFENIGVLQGYEYLKGVITDDPDQDADTCTLTIGDAEYADVPIFYHCSEDAEEREDNGAIEGAAFGFVKDEGVIVLKQRQGAPGHDGEPASEPKIFVIGHLSGIAPCCWTEPWDGPLYTTKWPWQQLAAYIRVAPGTLTDDATAIIADGKITFSFGPTPAMQGWLEQQHGWKYDPATPIKTGVSRVLFDAEIMIDCYESGDENRNYFLYIAGKKDGADVFFQVWVLNNDPTYAIMVGGVSQYLPLIGCTGVANAESEWVQEEGAYDVWHKAILNSKTDYITLPVTGVEVDYVMVFMTVYAPGGTDPPDGGIAGGSMVVNRIEIC